MMLLHIFEIWLFNGAVGLLFAERNRPADGPRP